MRKFKDEGVIKILTTTLLEKNSLITGNIYANFIAANIFHVTEL